MSYPGRGSLWDIKERLKTVEQNSVDVASPSDGLERVGNELRLSYRDLPLAPGN